MHSMKKAMAQILAGVGSLESIPCTLSTLGPLQQQGHVGQYTMLLETVSVAPGTLLAYSEGQSGIVLGIVVGQPVTA